MAHSYKLLWIVTGGATVLLVILLLAVRANAFFPDADLRILLTLNGSRIRGGDSFLSALTDANTFVSVTSIVGVGVVAFMRRSPSLAWKGAVLLTTLLVGALVVYVLKQSVERPRPFVVNATVEKLSGGGSPSFPSGHVTEAFAMLTAVVLLFPRQRWVAACLIVWTVFIAYSRIATGVHFPSDVLGGALAGIATAGIVNLCFRSRVQPASHGLR